VRECFGETSGEGMVRGAFGFDGSRRGPMKGDGNAYGGRGRRGVTREGRRIESDEIEAGCIWEQARKPKICLPAG